MSTIQQTIERYQALGFDQTSTERGRAYRVKCSQCAVMVINGVPTHEHGCPNTRHECRGCNELVPMNVRYCAACQ